MLKITNFSIGYAGLYEAISGKPDSGTKINIKAVVEVTEIPIVLRKHIEWCDGKVVMDYTYPSNQSETNVGTYVYEETDYMHINWLLPFSISGHIYKLLFEYQDSVTGNIYSAEAETRFFNPIEVIVIVGGIGVAIGITVVYYKTKKLK